MKKTITFLLLLAFIIMPAKAADVENVKPVKNVILLIPDGTSLATVSMARWLQWYTNRSRTCLSAAYDCIGSRKNNTGQIDRPCFHLRISSRYTGRLFRP